MLTAAENETLTRIGPGTPMGEVLRRYWHPVGCSQWITKKPQRIKVLGEELVLYRRESGRPALMQLRCAHRSVALDYGRVEGDCIRCPITAGSMRRLDNVSNSRPNRQAAATKTRSA
jgi:5,5'-dehydrodivanillate O-demethylase oxygenase subunit